MRRITIAFLLVVVALSLHSCNKNNDNLEGNVVIIADDIDQPTTWQTGKVYLVKAWDFYVNSTLTIQPGVVVKFHPTEGPEMTLGGDGTIIAHGSDAQPIVFTSYKDDDHGGDTNHDGQATQPGRKDWGGISTNGLNGSIFEYCQFLYGGNNSYTYTLQISYGAATVHDCVFAHNDGSDPSGWYGTLDASTATSGTVIQNNLFYDNIRPLSISTFFNLDNSNTFHNPDNVSQANQYNGIFVYTSYITDARVWQETEVAYVIDDNDWWINSGGTLTLGDNVVIKFRTGSYLSLQAGTSALVNYNGTGVYFTSYKDDAHGGDTNGDGAGSAPMNGDWGGIYNDVSGTYMTWANILYDTY
jgi:hypothetical protein